MQIRSDLWQQPPARIAAAGGPNWRLSPFVRDSLTSTGATLIEQPLRTSDGSISPDVQRADVLVTGAAVLDEPAISQLQNVRFVLRPYVGYDDVDVAALSRHGILFANVPDAFIEEVANHAMALMLACNRKLLQTDAFVKSGAWSGGARNRQASIPIRRPSVLTLGLVGFGNIARLVVPRAKPFGFRIIAADPYVDPEVGKAMGVEMMPIDELLPQSDIVSLHVFLNAETRHLMNAARFALMKPEAFLINTSRGPVVDEAALVAALQTRQLAGAGLDVFETEPMVPDNPLLKMRNVVLTAHTASYSIEGDVALNERTFDILSRVVKGELPERKVVVDKPLYDALAKELAASSDRVPTPG